MPFKLPEYEEAFIAFLYKTTNKLARVHHPLLAQMQVESSEGGGSSVVDSRDSELLDLSSESVSFEMTADREDLRNSNYEPLVKQLDSAGDELGGQLVGVLLGTLNDVTASTGNVVDAEGQKFSFELLLEMLEKIEFSLDENDELVMPSIVMHPNQMKSMPTEVTPEQRAQMDDLKKRKRDELLAKRRSRRLS